MSAIQKIPVRLASSDDADAIGRLLHDFNSEYNDDTPGPAAMAARMAELIDTGDADVLLAGFGPEGLAVLRFRPCLWDRSLECYLAELYVVPAKRGAGIGGALMEGAMDHARERGASYMDLCTGEEDRVARHLYESIGFSNREGKPDGPLNYYYEREL